MKKLFATIFSIVTITVGVKAEQAETVNIFQRGENGYACYRIPAIVQTKSGTLIAFAEARKNSCSDTNNIDLVLKRSTDNGKTWGPQILIWDAGDNTCGNPAPIVDQETGKIVLLACWNLGEDHESQIMKKKSKDTRRVFVLSSTDDGVSWSEPKEITPDVKEPDWTWYATGPCHGIQLQGNRYKGRMVVSANHARGENGDYHAQLLYSDDKGDTWKLGGVVAQKGGNESSVVELSNGDLMLNMRNYNREISQSRSYVISQDGGETVSATAYLPELIEPVCQGSTINYAKGSSQILFSNPASVDKRIKMTIKLSVDNGKSWPYQHEVYAGRSAYSDLVILQNGKIGLIYEYGVDDDYEQIGFTTISYKDLIE